MLSVVWAAAIGIIIIVIIVMKIINKKQEIVVKTVLLLFVVLMLTLAHVYVKTGAEVNNPESVISFGKAYFIWLGTLFSNAKSLTAQVINLDWDVENKTKS